jgi:hypothetical protein
MNDITIRRPYGSISLPDNDQWDMRFEIRSESSGRIYIIARNKKSSKFACSCPGWKRWRVCKHLTEGCGLNFSQIHGHNLTDQRSRQRAISGGN